MEAEQEDKQEEKQVKCDGWCRWPRTPPPCIAAEKNSRLRFLSQIEYKTLHLVGQMSLIRPWLVVISHLLASPAALLQPIVLKT